MTLAIVELGEACGVTPDGESLPILNYHDTEREAFEDAATSTTGTKEAPGLKASSSRQSTAIAVVTSVEGDHFVAFGAEPVADDDGSCPCVPEGTSRSFIVNPGDIAAVMAAS